MKEKETNPENENNFYVVGIGASAGGLEALEKFIRNVDSKSGMAYIVVQHLSPDYKSLMVELLSKHTNMEVMRAEDGLEIHKNRVYLIPPKKNMTVFHGKLFLTEQKLHHGLNLPIDIFFRSLADDYGERAIGIVLSGTGSDGTLGIRAIKGAGGMVMAQDEDTAKFDGMPKSAIATGMVDFILPPEKMGEHLLNYTNHPLVVNHNAGKKETSKNQDNYSKILSLIRHSSGTDFTYYKPNTIIRRIERRISIHQLQNIEEYVDFITKSPHEVKILYKELLIGVTKFFRDLEAFKVIEEEVIPKILSKAVPKDVLRFWVVGCSTGEEAYSLAILIKEYLDKHGRILDIKIFATDIDKESIEYASAGVYPESIVADVTPERLKSYFVKNGTTYKVNESIRQMVIFATHNIIKDPPFSKIDFISCRNLLIYLETYMQKRVFSAFSFSLNKGAYLFLGNSESLGDMSDAFATVNMKWKIYTNLRTEKRALLDEYRLGPVQRDLIKPAKEYDRSNKVKEDFHNYITQELFDSYVPPAVVINEKYDVIHTYNNVNKYLKIPQGRISLNLMNMIPHDLSIPISTSIHKVLKENTEVNYSDISFKLDDKLFKINLKVKSLSNDRVSAKYILIIFEEISDELESEYTKYEVDKSKSLRVNDLEQELKYTKENLQATIEELETSNEELQATNEELIASNEELQSTNEELQSVNEELYTVNSEYQQKIEELTELNNDINNWFKTSNISTIFLDLKLRVRKYTPEINRYVNLIQSDIGRPFKHISYNFGYASFFKNVETVLDNLHEISHEVKLSEERWVNIKILPYRTTENAVKGVVITFIDISDLKVQEQKLIQEHDLLNRILENNPVANVLVDSDGIIQFANRKAEELFQMSRKEILGLKFNSRKWNVTDKNGKQIPDEKRPFDIIRRTGKSVSNIVEYHRDNDGNMHALNISGSPDLDAGNVVKGAVFAIEPFERE
jgi:two-component system CheB/CheR fusion protein